jgi:hypothetical protein
MQFGRSSERITRQIAQLELQLEELETGEAEDTAKSEASDPLAPVRERKKPKRKPLPGHLPRQAAANSPECRASFCELDMCDWLAGHVGLELRNPYANHVFEIA